MTTMNAVNYWKNDIDDLRSRAEDVRLGFGARTRQILTPHEVARALMGTVSFVVRTYGNEAMQAACAVLVRHQRAWETRFTDLPAMSDGKVDPAVQLLAIPCAGLMGVASKNAVASALSFWATESDPTEWQRIFR